RQLAAIMFTDMVGYSTLAQRNEALALELLAESQRLLRTQFPLFNGREVKTTGDGFLVEFPSALQATQCAVEIQRAVAARNGAQPAERHIQVRIGIHVGDVVHREADMYGDGVNIAARIEPLAIGGGICLSDTVYAQVRNKLDVGLTKMSAPDLKHIEVPVDVYRVMLPWQQAPVAGQSGSLSPSKSSAHLVAVGLILALALGGLGWWLFRSPGQAAKQAANPPTNPPGSPVTATEQKSIAVLPFVNMSPDKNDEYLSDGMTVVLIDKLGNVPGLRVPGRSSCFAFKGRTEEDILRKVGDQLRVSTVLEGDVLKIGDKLRITARLINVADGSVLWSQPYDGDMKDILDFQSSVAQRVVQVLRLKLGVEAARAFTKVPTENPEAHRLYLLGRYHFGKNTEASLTNAMQYFTRALQLDPSYALAYCGLADCYGWLGGNLLSGKEAWANEKELAQKALALDPNLADAHLSLGMALASAFDWKGGEQEMKRALELNPGLALAYDQSAWIQATFGRFEEAIANTRKAIELDPLSLLFNTHLGWQLSHARRYDEAMAQLRKTLELEPHYANAHFEMGWCYLGKGDTAGALAAFQRAKSLDSPPWFDGALAYAYARAGNRAQAEQVVRDWADRAKQRYLSPSLRMHLHLGLGDKDKALDWLEKCYEEQDGDCWSLKTWQIYDPLRTEPRFQALLEKVGLDP
ncbi:MAG TPA: hypothetical protein DCE44_06620, partial [Verrucomicrobiales bacterium]|nr:hypothetical protein [Verrucomicrobiales bacterium]